MVFDAVIMRETTLASSPGRKKKSYEPVATKMSVVFFFSLKDLRA
jgi:hypothetical protein